MYNVNFSQIISILKEFSKNHPHIPQSEIDLFLKSNESNFIENSKHTPFIYLIIQILEKSHQMYLELSNRDNEKINLLHNIKNEPTKAITNYLKKIEMANTLYSQIMFEDDTNYFPLIEKILNDFKDNPSEAMIFFQNNREHLDQKDSAFWAPLKNGYKELYTRSISNVWGGNNKEHRIELKKEIIIDYHYELLQAYPLISKDINQIQKKLYTSASIKIFKLLQFAQFPIKPYRLKEYIEELFIALEYPIKVYPDKIDQAYSFALYNKHYVYKYPSKENNYKVFPSTRIQHQKMQLNFVLENITKTPYPHDFEYVNADILAPILF